jgi:type I restriction enzyme, R subunit
MLPSPLAKTILPLGIQEKLLTVVSFVVICLARVTSPPDANTQILKTGVFTADDAKSIVKLLAAGNDAQVQFAVNGLRSRFLSKIADTEERKILVYLLARFVKSFHFLTCFFTYSPTIGEFAVFAEYVGPQLIKQGSVSELMKQIRQTEVVKAAVQFQGEVHSAGTVKLKSGKGMKSAGPPPNKVSVQDMITEIRATFNISDEEALYIKEVTEEKTKDPSIQATVKAHQEDRIYLEGPFQGQVNGQIQAAYAERGRYDELGDAKYTDPGAIFDIMSITVIRHNLQPVASVGG